MDESGLGRGCCLFRDFLGGQTAASNRAVVTFKGRAGFSSVVDHLVRKEERQRARGAEQTIAGSWG